MQKVVNGLRTIQSCAFVLGTGESYGPTIQNSQHCLIFFIQLNYVYKLKQNKVLPPYVKLPLPQDGMQGIPLPLSSIQPHCMVVFLATAE